MMDENAKSAAPKDAREVMIDAMITSALHSAELAESYGLPGNHILLSAKVSGVQDLVDVYRELAARCEYPLHLGLTEAGMGAKGIVSSTAGLAILLQEGIGDTIRVSLTPVPGGDRTEEVQVAQQVLQSLGIRSFLPQVTACPGCGRTTSTYFQELAQQIQIYVREQMPAWRKQFDGVEEMKLAVMGCIVNGPGESKHANIGISLPGTFEDPKAPVFIDGHLATTLKGDHIVEEFKADPERVRGEQVREERARQGLSGARETETRAQRPAFFVDKPSLRAATLRWRSSALLRPGTQSCGRCALPGQRALREQCPYPAPAPPPAPGRFRLRNRLSGSACASS